MSNWEDLWKAIKEYKHIPYVELEKKYYSMETVSWERFCDADVILVSFQKTLHIEYTDLNLRNKDNLLSHSNMYSYSTRKRSNIYIEKYSLSKYKYSPICADVTFLINCPRALKKSMVKSWKRTLTPSFIKKCFYNKHEFFSVQFYRDISNKN